MVLTASFQKHQTDLGTFFSVKWEARDAEKAEEKQLLSQIEVFLSEDPALIDFSTPNLLVTDNLQAEEVQMLLSALQ